MPPPISPENRREIPRSGRQRKPVLGRFLLWGLLLLAALSWLAIAWSLSEQYRHWRDDQFLHSRSLRQRELTASLASNLARTLAQQEGIAQLLGQEAQIRAALQTPRLARLNAAGDSDSRQRRLRADPLLPPIQHFLVQASEYVGSDHLFIANAHGICIASSNAGLPDDFVGLALGERDYFRHNLAGHIGRQQLIGLQSRIPGLYIATPVFADEQFLGSIISKVNNKRLRPLLSRSEGLISDADGVILLAVDPRLETRALPGSNIEALTPALRTERYGTSQLSLLPWQLQSGPNGSLLANSGEAFPLILSQHDIVPGWLRLTLIDRAPEFRQHQNERDGLFIVLAFAGLLLLLAAANAQQARQARGKTQAMLSEQHLRLDHAQRVAQLGSWQRRSLDDDILWSEEIFRIFELPASHRKISLRDFLHRIPRQERLPVLHAYRRLFENGEPYLISHSLLFPDGRHKEVSERGEVIRDDLGQPRLFLGTVQDISAQRALAKALRDSEITYRTIFESSADGLALLDPTTASYLTCNDAMLDLLGQPSLLNRSPADFSPERQGNGELSREAQAFRIMQASGEGKCCFEWQHRRADGKLLTVMVTLCHLQLHGESRLLAIVRDFTERKQLEEKLAELALSDPLTGIANRRHFMTQAENELTRCRRYSQPLSLLMFDLDHFKAINDRHGHQTGDLVLQKVAGICRSGLREVDLLARLGGEEFAILLPQTGGRDARRLADRLRQAIANSPLLCDQGPALSFSVSVGVATLKNDDEKLDALLLRADQRLYQAKAAGRNRVVGPEAPE